MIPYKYERAHRMKQPTGLMRWAQAIGLVQCVNISSFEGHARTNIEMFKILKFYCSKIRPGKCCIFIAENAKIRLKSCIIYIYIYIGMH